jgi:probable phosphoglycerate mutase
MNAPTTISLVRHGHIENPDRVFHGRLPGFPLSERGKKEAAAAAALLQDEPVVAIYTSPMLRARQTAAILQAAFKPQPPIAEEPLLNEIYSPYDGRPWTELEARDWDFYTGTAPKYEQPETILARVLAFLQRERQRHRGEHVVGVTHADPLAFLWLWLFEKPLTADNRKWLGKFGLPDDYPATASVTTLTFATADPEEKPHYRYLHPT